MKKKIMRVLLIAAFSLAGGGFYRAADAYPAQPLKVMVSFSAGSMGVVLADNRLGAHGIISAGAAAAGVEKQ
ncbi:hypothetical protein D3C80_1830950 [compost metagenome]